MKSALFYLFLILAPCDLHSQSVQRQTTSATGSSSMLHYGEMRLSILSSVGQASAIGSGLENKFHLRQGFIQPFSPKSIHTSVNTDLEANVYPNPFREDFQIDFTESLSAAITLFDLTGKVLFRREIHDANDASISASHLARGTYILHIQSGSKRFNGRVIKL